MSAGTYKGKFAGGGGDGDFRLTLGPDGKGGLKGEVMFTMAGQEVPCKTTSLKIDGASLKNVADTLASKIHGARKVVIAGASHHPPVETPREFNRLLLDFLR